MYQPKDISDIQSQMKRRIMALFAPALMLLGLVIFSFMKRVEWLTAALFALLGCMVLFSLSLYILPVMRYKRHLQNAVHGRKRRSVLAFKSAQSKAVLRGGVAFYPILFTAGSPQEPMDDRQLYWDANLPLPPWQPGDRLVIHSHEKALTRWEPAGVEEALNG